MPNILGPTNFNRAAWAAETLSVFRHRTGCDYEDALGDLLSDLMHWADQHEFDFEAALIRARDHHACEVAEEAAYIERVKGGAL